MFKTFTAITLLCALAAAPPANADDFAERLANAARLSLLSGYVAADGTYRAGIRVDLLPGWKTYWRAPGNSGIAPEFDFSGSENVASVDVFWPEPDLMTDAGVLTIGFANEMVLPLKVVAVDPAAPVNLVLDMEFGVCEDVCVPFRASAEALLGYGPHTEIDAWIAREPMAAAEAGMTRYSCAMVPDEEDYVLTATLTFTGAAPAPEIVVIETGSDLSWVASSGHESHGSELTVSATVMHFGDPGTMPDPSTMRFTLLGHGTGIDLVGC